MASQPLRVEGDFPVYFRYTAGIAGERFLREIKDNARLIASRCPKCALNYLPPRIYCERCMAKLEEYVYIANNGIVETITICMQDADGVELKEPVPVVLARFPNAHGGIVHRARSPISIGDKVRLIFKEKPKRVGSILDIEYFEKVP